MKQFIKNIEHSKVTKLVDEVSYQDGQVVSKTLGQNDQHSITLFAFEKGEEISSHASSGDAMVNVIDGECIITIDGEKYELSAGQTIIMPANKPHALYASERFKMILTVIFS